MTTYEFGKACIALLGLYIALSGAMIGVSMSAMMSPLDLSSIGIALGTAVAFAVVPGLLVVRARRRLAYRWCASESDEGSPNLNGTDLLRVGLVLLGLYLLVSGVLELLGAISTLVIAASAHGDLSFFTTRNRASSAALTSGAGTLVRGAASIVSGVLVLRMAPAWSERWLPRKQA